MAYEGCLVPGEDDISCDQDVQCLSTYNKPVQM